MNIDGDKFAERRLAAIVESSDDAIIFKDLNGIINAWNKSAERIFGYTAEEVIGKPVTILIPQEYQDEESDIIARIRRGKRVDHYETVRRRKGGQSVNISLTVSPVKDDDGTVIGASKIARDITDRKQAERKLAECFEREKAARQQIEVVARTKDDFIAMLSHELRTPLSPVLLIASDCAKNPELPADIRAQFETILKNVEVESALIDDLLDLSRINHNKLNLKMQTVDAHSVLCEAIQTVRSQIEAKQIQVVSNLNAEQHFILADAVRLQQVFWNILKNAIKFTAKGGKITLETFSAVEGGRLNLKICDTGIGMTPKELEQVFYAFSQGDHIRDNSANYGGLGLGLTIAKRLVELHSGRIGAASEGRGCGSTFMLEFPLA